MADKRTEGGRDVTRTLIIYMNFKRLHQRFHLKFKKLQIKKYLVKFSLQLLWFFKYSCVILRIFRSFLVKKLQAFQFDKDNIC